MKSDEPKPELGSSVPEVNALIIEWVEEMMTTKKYGVYGIEIPVHEGIPLSILKTERCNLKRSIGGGSVLLT